MPPEPEPEHPPARRPSPPRWRLPLVFALLSALFSLGCHDNVFTGNLTPVPPVHRMPADVVGAVILIDQDPVIETKDPEHIARANRLGVPRDYRAAMVKALELAGFVVLSKPSAPPDLVGRLAIAVTEDGEDVRQVYRCGLSAPDGTPVAQVDWAWPKGTFVDTSEVFEFATHNVATEVATSRRVVAWLRARRGGAPATRAPAPGPASGPPSGPVSGPASD